MVSLSNQISFSESPLCSDDVWRIESFLLRIFEYGNYSFRRALAGTYHKELKCVFYLAYEGDAIIGAAGCLFSANQPLSAILSPVAVEPQRRRRGIATELCSRLMHELQNRGVKRIFVAASSENRAKELYYRLGFSDCSGIVMTKDWQREQSKYNEDASIKNMSWEEYAEVSALLCEPASLATVSYQQGVFSSKYEPVKRFLPVFPELMQAVEKNAGCAKLVKHDTGRVIGLAHIQRPLSNLQQHISYLDFFGEDGFENQIEALVHNLCVEYKQRHDGQLIIWVPEFDHVKKEILNKSQSKKIGMLPQMLMCGEKTHSVEVYAL